MAVRKKMRFGIMIAPLHAPQLNPAYRFERDMRLLEHVDMLGFDEAWIGEHHSSGYETIASPEIFIAAAAQRTRDIKLGAGVITLPLHNPLMVADRLVQLDYMTRGRVMFGAGPGQLPSDAAMLGYPATEMRPRMEERLDIVLRLLDGETVTHEGAGFVLKDATLQLLPYSDIEVAVTASITPNGPTLAGKHGVGMITLGATSRDALTALANQWKIAQDSAAKWGKTVSRESWRVLNMMHIAQTRDEARQEAKYGVVRLMTYYNHLLPGLDPANFSSVDDLLDVLIEAKAMVIGTPEDAIESIEEVRQSTGGFGTYVQTLADLGSQEATMRSLTLFAEEVIPHFTGQADRLIESYNSFMQGDFIARTSKEGFQASFEKHARESGAGQGEASA